MLITVIQQAGLATDELRGSAVIKLMGAISSIRKTRPDFPIIDAGPDSDSQTGVIFQVVADGHSEVLRMEISDILNVA